MNWMLIMEGFEKLCKYRLIKCKDIIISDYESVY